MHLKILSVLSSWFNLNFVMDKKFDSVKNWSEKKYLEKWNYSKRIAKILSEQGSLEPAFSEWKYVENNSKAWNFVYWIWDQSWDLYFPVIINNWEPDKYGLIWWTAEIFNKHLFSWFKSKKEWQIDKILPEEANLLTPTEEDRMYFYHIYKYSLKKKGVMDNSPSTEIFQELCEEIVEDFQSWPLLDIEDLTDHIISPLWNNKYKEYKKVSLKKTKVSEKKKTKFKKNVLQKPKRSNKLKENSIWPEKVTIYYRNYFSLQLSNISFQKLIKQSKQVSLIKDFPVVYFPTEIELEKWETVNWIRFSKTVIEAYKHYKKQLEQWSNIIIKFWTPQV